MPSETTPIEQSATEQTSPEQSSQPGTAQPNPGQQGAEQPGAEPPRAESPPPESSRAELSRIERPDAAQYAEKRKIFLVPLIFGPPDPSDEFDRLARAFWDGVDEQVRRLEQKIGEVRRVYHEAIPLTGEEALDAVKLYSEQSHIIAASKVASGATFEALEDREAFAEYVDWQRCLTVGLTSEKVAQLVFENFRDAEKRRNEAMGRRIDETLRPGESGILFVQERHSIQFPPDIQVFFVAPPGLDDIHTWIRDNMRQQGFESG